MTPVMTKAQEQEKREAIETLRELVKPGDTVYTILRHVSRSGMSRIIDVFVMQDGAPRSVAFQVSKALGSPMDRERWGVKAGGCGMDMGFHVVYNLGYVLWPQGFGCAGDKCPSNDHSNGDRDFEPHGAFRPDLATKDPSGLYNVESQHRKHMHKDGGYALRHRWL